MATSRLPLVVVLGATGAGKSKLAIEIAKMFKGEIISADSMQIYKGLDIITNKVSPEEQQECPHHLISYLEADHAHYSIVDFRDAAVPIIDDLLTKRILPIVVGGTNYYIESVLWNFLIDKKPSNMKSDQVPKITSPQINTYMDTHVTDLPLAKSSVDAPVVRYNSASTGMEQLDLQERLTLSGCPKIPDSSQCTTDIQQPSSSSSQSTSCPDQVPQSCSFSSQILGNRSSRFVSESLTSTSSFHSTEFVDSNIGSFSNHKGALDSSLDNTQPLEASAAQLLHSLSAAKGDTSSSPSSCGTAVDGAGSSENVHTVSDDFIEDHSFQRVDGSARDTWCVGTTFVNSEDSPLQSGEHISCDFLSSGLPCQMSSDNPGLLCHISDSFGLFCQTSDNSGLSCSSLSIHWPSGDVHRPSDCLLGSSTDVHRPSDCVHGSSYCVHGSSSDAHYPSNNASNPSGDDHGLLSDALRLSYDTSGLSCNNSNNSELSQQDKPKETHKNPQDFRHDSIALLRCLNGMSSVNLYSHLQGIDPQTASRMHPNNRRKIIRAIQVYYQCEQTMSSLLSEQHGGQENVKSGPLRFPSPCILWVKCQQSDLNARLDGRVDEMMARGLVAELELFQKEAARLESLKQNNSSLDTGHTYTHGILQMIGFKEFHDYLQLSPEARATDQGQKLLQQGVSDLKLATRRYARQQVRWITNRFCNRPGSNVPPIYAVDSSDLTQWDKTVEEAIQVVKAFIDGEVPMKDPETVVPKVETRLVRNVCDLCQGRIFLHTHEWTDHLKSKKHKFNVKMLARERRQLSQLLSAREEQLKQMAGETSSTVGRGPEGSSPEDHLYTLFL